MAMAATTTAASAATLYAHDPLFSSPAMTSLTSQCFSGVVAEDDENCWTAMPTPPVSPKVACTAMDSATGSDVEDLDLGLSDLLGMDNFFDQEWLFGEVQNEVLDAAASVVSSSPPETSSPLRHDCMWAGHCPATEQHRGGVLQLPNLLSSSPNDVSNLLMSTTCRTRLDTLGSIQPETPLSLSDSEMDGEPLTSQAESSSNSSSSSSDDESESDDGGCGSSNPIQIHLPAHIHPVRSTSNSHHHARSKLLQSTKSKHHQSSAMMFMSSSADHSYSHSDHCYHTQRRPVDHQNGGALTPSDSGKSLYVPFHFHLC